MEAEEHKKRGNELLAAGKLAEAAEAYTLAIQADPSSSALRSNRSHALLKAGDANGALSDAEEAVRISPSWPKGQLRRARALEALGRYREAIEACNLGERAATIAGSQEAQEFKKLCALLEARGAAPSESASTSVSTSTSTPSKASCLAELSAHAVVGGAVAEFFDGVVSVEIGDGWVRPWRLAHEQRLLYDPSLAAQAACAAVRLLLRTSGRELRLVTSMATPPNVDAATLSRNGGFPMEYELYVNGDFFARKQLGCCEGPTTILFDSLPDGEKDLEVWLPPAVAVDVHALDSGGALQRVQDDQRPVWVCYGSSICHGGPTQASPSGTWPSVCSRLANVRVVNLGFGGQCFLDQGVARAIRDMKCDCISMKVGINIQCLGALTERTFPAAIIGFVQTIRDGHPKTPLVLVSPIFSEPFEEQSPIKRHGFMSLVQFREKVQAAVATLRTSGDTNIFYRDGLELLGKNEQALLYDGLHPGGEGHSLMGQRFAQLEFGPAGRLLPGRVAEGALPRPPRGPVLRQDIQGAYICEVPDGSRCRMIVTEVKGSLVCRSDRPDWPASPLHTREDLVFLRSTPGVWGHVESAGQAIKFSNGIAWVRLPSG